MTTLAKIGPIELSQAHEIVDPESDPGLFKLNLKCPPEQAKQLVGLCQPTNRDDYGTRIIFGRNSRWGLMPIESPVSSVVPYPNEYTGIIKGLGVLSNPMEYFTNTKKSKVEMDLELLSDNFDEFLTLLYSKGGEEGAYIPSEYEDKDEVTILEDDFTGAYTGNWTTYETYYLSGGSISTSGGKLVFVGAKTGTPGYGGWGRIKSYNKFTNTPPFSFEFDLEYVSASNRTHLSFIMVESTPVSWTLLQNTSSSNYIRFYIYYTGGNLYFGVVRCKAGKVTYLVPQQALNISTEANPNFKVDYAADGSMNIYIDKTGGTTFGDPIWSGKTGFVWSSPDFMWNMNTIATSSVTMKSGNFKTYTEEEVSKPNITVAPPDANCNLTPDFTRASEFGDVQCFKDIVDSLNYQITPANFYKGTVKAWNGNYSDSVYRQVTWNSVELDPTKFYVTNGLIKLTTTTSGVVLSVWNGSSYVTVQTFTLPQSISLIRPFMVTPWEFTLQLDRTYWTIRAGKYGVWVEHPYDDIGYIIKPNYYHDGEITTNPSADADITMEDIFYSLAFDLHNLFTQNQFDLETGAATGWSASGGTPSIVSPGAYGTYALKCVTNNSVANEGIITNTAYYRALPVTPAVGLPIRFRPYIKGTGTVKLYVIERDSGGSLLAQTTSDVITLNSTYTSRAVVHEIQDEDAVYVSAKVLTDVQQSAEIYIDQNYLAPYPDASLTASLAGSGGPVASKRYGLIITKKDPTTIKSDSIPASNLTGLGVYDQMQPPSNDNGFIQLAREWHKPTQQALALQSI